MKSNFKELFNAIRPELLEASEINIDDVLDGMMESFRFEGRVSKERLTRELLRARLTSELNRNEIYSYGKGHYVFLGNANEQQAVAFVQKAKHDLEAHKLRMIKAETRLDQLTMAWDKDGHFVGIVANGG